MLGKFFISFQLLYSHCLDIQTTINIIPIKKQLFSVVVVFFFYSALHKNSNNDFVKSRTRKTEISEKKYRSPTGFHYFPFIICKIHRCIRAYCISKTDSRAMQLYDRRKIRVFYFTHFYYRMNYCVNIHW